MSANDDTTTIKDKYSQLGTIRVEYKRAIKPKSPMRRSSRRFSPPSSLMDRIPEKALKGRPIQVRTNNSEEIRGPQPFYSSKKVDDEPLARFIFKYRTKGTSNTAAARCPANENRSSPNRESHTSNTLSRSNRQHVCRRTQSHDTPAAGKLVRSFLTRADRDASNRMRRT